MLRPSNHKVFITGVGLVTPVGNTVATSWDAVIHGRSGISSFEPPLELGHAASVAGRVKGEQELVAKLLPEKDLPKTDRFMQLALVAADEALRDAGLDTQMPADRERFGTYVGVGIGGLGNIENGALGLAQRGHRAISPFLLPSVLANEAPAWLSMKLQLLGPSMAIINACSSGNDAIGQAYRAIRDGHADYMIAGGAESCLTPLAFVGFGNMRALSTWKGDPTQASRPFDKDRSGFVMAEGAGFVILERADFARKRGAKVYAELVGYGAASDAYHITAIHPEGAGAVRAINQVFKQAEVGPEHVGYINAHGTATPMNDASEAAIIKKVFGTLADRNIKNHVLVSSTKSMTGHMLGGAGGAEVVFSALALTHGIVPPTINCDNQDPLCDIDCVAHAARNVNLSYVMSNSFGFGGANSVILLKKV